MAFSFNGLAAEVEITGAVSTSNLPATTEEVYCISVDVTGAADSQIVTPGVGETIYLVGITNMFMSGAGAACFFDGTAGSKAFANADADILHCYYNSGAGAIINQPPIILTIPRKLDHGIRLTCTAGARFSGNVYYIKAT